MSTLVTYYVSSVLIFFKFSLNPFIYCWRYYDVRNIVKHTVTKLLIKNFTSRKDDHGYKHSSIISVVRSQVTLSMLHVHFKNLQSNFKVDKRFPVQITLLGMVIKAGARQGNLLDRFQQNGDLRRKSKLRVLPSSYYRRFTAKGKRS